MVKLSSVNGKKQYGQYEYVVDSLSDISNVPPSCEMGSIVLVIETGQVFMKNSKGDWVEI